MSQMKSCHMRLRRETSEMLFKMLAKTAHRSVSSLADEILHAEALKFLKRETSSLERMLAAVDRSRPE